jgi:hypothetical protein
MSGENRMSRARFATRGPAKVVLNQPGDGRGGWVMAMHPAELLAKLAQEDLDRRRKNEEIYVAAHREAGRREAAAELARLRDENARLREENSRLRGEPTEPTSILDAMNELREASGGAWDLVADPEAYLRGKDGPATGEGGGR